MTWAEVIKATRRACGLKQAALAEVIGTDQATVSRWERGLNEPAEGAKKAYLDRCHERIPEVSYLNRLVEAVHNDFSVVMLTEAGSFKKLAVSNGAHRVIRRCGAGWPAKDTFQYKIFRKLGDLVPLFEDRSIHEVEVDHLLSTPDGGAEHGLIIIVPVLIPGSTAPNLIIKRAIPNSPAPLNRIIVRRSVGAEEILHLEIEEPPMADGSIRVA